MQGILEGFPQQQAVKTVAKNGPNICDKNIRNKIMYYISVSLCNGKKHLEPFIPLSKPITKSKTKESINMTLLLILIKKKHVFLFFRVWNSTN